MSQLERALYLAYTAHSGQVDKGGNPYILHPIYVSTKFDDNNLRIVAILHDVVEDTDVELKDLWVWNFDPEIIEAVRAITKLKDETYADYIKRLSENKLASIVKIEDMKHNCDESRAKDFDVTFLKKKYEKWMPFLKEKWNIEKTS